MADTKHQNSVHRSADNSAGNSARWLALGIAGLVGFTVGLLLGLVIGVVGSGPAPQARQPDGQSDQPVRLPRQVADLKTAKENPSGNRIALEPQGNLGSQVAQATEVLNQLADLRAMSEELSRTWQDDKPKPIQRKRMPPQPEAARSQPELPPIQPKAVSEQLPKAAPEPVATSNKTPIRRTQVGSLRIRIPTAVVGHVPLWDEKSGTEKKSAKRYLTIWLELENASRRERIPYHGWMGESAAEMDTEASLIDDDRNVYRLIGHKLGLPIRGDSTSVSISPGKMIKAALVFEPPAIEAEYVRLTLPAEAFGGRGPVVFTIPTSMVTFE